MTLAFLALLGAPYIYDISSLRVKMDLVDIEWETIDVICLAGDRDMALSSSEQGNEHSSSIKYREFLDELRSI